MSVDISNNRGHDIDLKNGNHFLKIVGTDPDTLIVAFTSNDRVFGGIQRFEFVKFLEKHFKNTSRHFYIDVHLKSYHAGIFGISNSIGTSVQYLQQEIKPYKNVIFLGVSSGGYAAILFGSLLNVASVVAFIPQTILRKKVINEKYRDISTIINNTTNYILYGDAKISDPYDCHHISHCSRIAHHKNVIVHKKHDSFDLKRMRDSGELYHIINSVVTAPAPSIR